MGVRPKKTQWAQDEGRKKKTEMDTAGFQVVKGIQSELAV